MARQDYGEALTTPILIPGWKLSDDGFGLHTISAVYKYDLSLGFNWTRGESFTVGDYNYCKLHKVSLSFDALGVITATAEYVGINPEINSGTFTNAQMTTAGGLTTEKIETNFYFPTDIAGPAPYTQSPLGPLVSIKNPEDYIQLAVGLNTLPVAKQQSFIGENGACFENEDGGKFLGFVDPAFPYFYGKTSYLAPQQTFSGIIYVDSEAQAKMFVDLLSVSSPDGNWNDNLPYIIPTYMGSTFVGAASYNQLLLTQSNVESFGTLFKINYEVKFSFVGWQTEVYLRIQDRA
jgi:hypothetical protein